MISHLTYRQLQANLKKYRNQGITPACEVRLNSKREVLEAAIVACLKFEKGLCQRKLELNPSADKFIRQEWAMTARQNACKLKLMGVAA